jgi:hypothetical protein
MLEIKEVKFSVLDIIFDKAFQTERFFVTITLLILEIICLEKSLNFCQPFLLDFFHWRKSNKIGKIQG